MSLAQPLPVRRPLQALALIGSLALALPGLADDPATTLQPAPDSYEAFQIISQRNIFAPGGVPKAVAEKPQPKVDAFTLVGTMSYEKGDFAFFDGTGPEYKKAAKVGDTIAGYTVTSIATEEVTLKTGDQALEFPLGKQLRREDGGEWKLVKMTTPFTPPILPEGDTAIVSNSGSNHPVIAQSGDAEMSEKRQRKLSRFSEEDVAHLKALKESGDSKALKEFITEQARAMGRTEKLSKLDKLDKLDRRAMKSQ